MKRAVTRTGVFWIEDGIMRGQMRRTEVHDEIDAEENVRSAVALCGGVKLPLLLDLRAMRDLTREARAFYATDTEAHLAAALALLIDSPFGIVIGNFFIRVNRPPFPVRIFRDEAEALRWLRATCDTTP